MASENTYWRDPELGEAREVEVDGTRIRAFVAGSGEPIVFQHGALVNANLWRKVVPLLATDFRCVTLDMPLGSHEIPTPDADLSPAGLADLLAGAIRELGLERPTLVGNDTGGGVCQIAVTRNPDLVGRLVLTSSDAYDQFPPAFFKYLLKPLEFPRLGPAAFAMLRLRAPRNLPIAYGWLVSGKLDPVAGDSYVLPLMSSREIATDLSRVLRGLDPAHTAEAAEKLRSFDRPVLIAWSKQDKFFKLEHGERLAADIPGARLEWIEGARTFSPEDQPARLAELIAAFIREPAAAAA